MQVGWVGYNTLRRSTMAPIGAVDQYYTILPTLGQWLGAPVHWLQLKHLSPGAEQPDLSTAEADEIVVHKSVVHYGDCFKPLMQWVNALPTTDRWQASVDNQFDVDRLKYEIPYLDAVVVESTGQMGAAYGIDYMLRLLYKRNPNIGFVIFDQDLASPTVKSKMRKWHPNPDSRTITATHYTLDRYPTQVVALSPHLSYRNQEPIVNFNGVAYVGNDYKRREPMLRLMRGPLFHHYGKLKAEFEPEMRAAGIQVHGPVVPTKNYTIEDLYRSHGAGVHCLREDAYRLQLIAVRLSEIARSGCIAFCDKLLAIGKVLSHEWCCVSNAAEIEAKLNQLQHDPALVVEMVKYQQQALGYYTSPDRFHQAIYSALMKVNEGPIYGQWKHNLYCDLMKGSGLVPWGAVA